MTVPDPPAPRRLARPKWLDVRVLGGILLLVVSVVVGAKVIGAASRTSPVWVAAGDLAAGTVLRAEDLVAADVNLGERGPSYVDAASDLVGRVLDRPIRAGEFLPASALDAVGDGRILSVAVTPDHMAPGVGHGSIADLYLVTGKSAVLGAEVATELLQRGVTIQSVTAPASGGLSGAISSRFQVALLLPADVADALVKKLPLGEPVIVLHTGRPVAAGG